MKKLMLLIVAVSMIVNAWAREVKKPIVIVSGCEEDLRTYAKTTYLKSIRQSGGVPLILPLTNDDDVLNTAIAMADAVLLTGGEDIDPLKWYNEEPLRELGTIAPARDEFDIKLARAAVKAGRPVLGICRGHQILCAAFGGTLYQDIPSQIPSSFVKHRQGETPRTYPTHTIVIAEGSKLRELIQAPEMRVNSFHHQAVKTCPQGFTITARAKDGVVEAMERTSKLTDYADGGGAIMGVQFHPEELTASGKSLEIFKHLIDCAKKAQSKKAQ